MPKLKIAWCLLVKARRFRYGNQQFLKNLGQALEKKQIQIVQVLNGRINLTNKNRGGLNDD